jgi:hypothetical protein
VSQIDILRSPGQFLTFTQVMSTWHPRIAEQRRADGALA